MKTYHEMIQFVVDQSDKRIFQYHEWVAAITIAEVYRHMIFLNKLFSTISNSK